MDEKRKTERLKKENEVTIHTTFPLKMHVLHNNFITFC